MLTNYRNTSTPSSEKETKISRVSAVISLSAKFITLVIFSVLALSLPSDSMKIIAMHKEQIVTFISTVMDLSTQSNFPKGSDKKDLTHSTIEEAW